ncbi:MAG: 50S ribosomal protein L11 methyltransferase [Clostridiales Family XIII bacterium]|jgi:ribosomal protein L11 methyltransferase|nr:50S ribosomal protein L11 methyltransferase [Clostridiales Family XIII bacterium]
MSDIQYYETTVWTTTQGVEPLSAILSGFGITEISVEDTHDAQLIMQEKDRLSWDYVSEDLLLEAAAGKDGDPRAVVKFYSEDSADGEKLLAAIRDEIIKLREDVSAGVYGGAADFGQLKSLTVPLSDDWKTKYKDYFKTFNACDNIVIRPPWEKYSPNDGEIVVVIDPGMAFGTGTHETTSMCIEAIRDSIEEKSAVSILDLGTGSGILAIVAAKLSEKPVVAVEMDEDALRSAAENIEANGVSEDVELIAGDVTKDEVLSWLTTNSESGQGYDVVAANLTSGILLLLLPYMEKLIRNGGLLILSGILAEEEEKMVNAVSAAGLSGISVKQKGEWLCITALKDA